jgi:peptidoglycan/xylan/chitin deacetylase (PgdA/CDA1 family)
MPARILFRWRRAVAGSAMRPLRADYNPGMEAAKRFAASGLALLLAACSSTPTPPPAAPPVVTVAPPAPPPPPPPPPPVERLPASFESKDFIVIIAKSGDTAASLAASHLGSAGRAWMIEEFGGRATLAAGQRVAIPRRDWNRAGVYASGYQVVPVLAYPAAPPAGRRRPAPGPSAFAEHMRYLRSAGYRPLRLADLIAFLQHERQLPRKSVLITFDDVSRDFLETAYPVLKELGFPAVLFAPTGAIPTRPGAPTLSWAELRGLAGTGIDVQAQARTLRDLRRGAGESADAYSRRMEQDIGPAVELLRKHLPRLPGGLETLAYPAGAWNDEVIRHARQYGYGAAFSLSGEPNPAFVPMFQLSRIAVPLDQPVDDFKRSLVTFHEQPILPARRDGPSAAHWTEPVAEDATRQSLAAAHREWAAELEQRGMLRDALDECRIARTIEPSGGPDRCEHIEAKIGTEEARLMKEGAALARAGNPDARSRLLAALALNPASFAAFEALRAAPTAARFLRHIIGPNESTASVADLYYGDRKRADIIEQANDLKPGAALTVGKVLRIPEIRGVPFLRPDR